jgi:hypothetical protein
VVRNGYLPQRTILTGIGPVEVKQPRVQDRRPPQQKEKFNSAILPPYLRKTKSIEELIPWLYLKGISTGDFSQALAALLGPQAKGLSAATITRLKAVWVEEYDAWSKPSSTTFDVTVQPISENRRFRTLFSLYHGLLTVKYP